MFKIKLLFSVLFLVALKSSSQNTYDYVGGLKLNDSLVLSYKINIEEHDGQVKGYSITDLGGAHETRSNIFGEYNANAKILSFREVGIIYTKSQVSQNDFCFLNTTLRRFTLGKTKKITANFVGLFSDNTKCIDGKILLNSFEKAEKRLEKVVAKINKSNKVADSIKQSMNAVHLANGLEMNILKKETTLSVFTKFKTIKLIVFDGGKLDGDVISITANGKPVLNTYEVTKTKKIIHLTLDTSKTVIRIKANNEGSIAPNTVVVEVQDEENTIKALSNLKAGESTEIDILK